MTILDCGFVDECPMRCMRQRFADVWKNHGQLFRVAHRFTTLLTISPTSSTVSNHQFWGWFLFFRNRQREFSGPKWAVVLFILPARKGILQIEKIPLRADTGI